MTQGSINDDTLCAGNKNWKLNNHYPGPGLDQWWFLMFRNKNWKFHNQDSGPGFKQWMIYSLCSGNKYWKFHNQDPGPRVNKWFLMYRKYALEVPQPGSGLRVWSMTIPYVQEISTQSSTTRIRTQGSIVLSMMIPYVQEISTGNSATRIPGQGLISDDSLSAGNKYLKFYN